jgi:hypothetical protein
MNKDRVIQARLLRAKARFAANLRAAAHQGTQSFFWFGETLFLDSMPSWSDLQAILLVDPNHREARELLPLPGGKITSRIDHVSRLSCSCSSLATSTQSCTVPFAWVSTFLK